MPTFCLVVGCSNDKKKRPELSFCRVPKVITNQGESAEALSSERRTKWLAAISRDDLTESILENDRVCGIHFHSGKSAKPWDKFNRDWVPSLNLGHEKIKDTHEQKAKAEERAKRVVERRKRELVQSVEADAREKVKRLDEPGQPIRLTFQQVGRPNTEDSGAIIRDTEEMPYDLDIDSMVHMDGGNKSRTTETQTEEFTYLFENSLKQEQAFDEDYFRGDDKKVRFYTGLHSFEVLMKTFDFVKHHVNRRSLNLTKFQEFIMILIKLRLNVPHLDLAYRFNVSLSVVSRIFLVWMTVMDIRLTPLISWPDREDLYRSMPRCFIDSFGYKTTVIIDCFEIFVDRPTNLMARAQTFSSYKNHNTAKVLIGITPQGTVSFVSQAWGGRTSDKFLTENCGFLKHLLPGDLVLADRGFTIHEEVWYYGANLNIPAFTKGKDQLDPIDIENTRNIANVRIHVERVIGFLRQKYTILQSTLPTSYLMCNSGDTVPLIDRIIRVCSALVNLCPPIIPFD